MKAYFDGHSDVNTGLAKFSFVIVNGYDKFEKCETFGHTDNNAIKYYGLIKLLQYIKKNKLMKVKIYGDSSMIIKQVNGLMNCHKDHLKPLCRKCIAYLKESIGNTVEIIEKKNNLAHKPLIKEN